MTASLLGDGIFYVALAWQAYETLERAERAVDDRRRDDRARTSSSCWRAASSRDRFDRRKVMIAADLMRAVAVGAMGALALSGRLELWHMIVLSGLFGAGTAFFGPAFDAIVPGLVPDAELNQANSLDQLVRPGGPADARTGAGRVDRGDGWRRDRVRRGRLHVRRSRSPAWRSCVPDARPPTTPHGSAIADIREGFAFVRSQVWLWGTFLAATLGYLIFWGPSEVLLPFVVRNDMHGSAARPRPDLRRRGDRGDDLRDRDGQPADAAQEHDLHLRRLDGLDARDRRLRSRAVPVAGDGGLLRVQRARGRGDDRLGDDQGAPGARPAARAGLELRLVHLDRARAGLLRVHRPDRRGVRAPRRRSSAPVCWAAASPWPSCSCRGCATSSGAASSWARRSTRPRDTGFGALEGPLAPISAGQGPFPASGTSGAALRSPVRPTDI